MRNAKRVTAIDGWTDGCFKKDVAAGKMTQQLSTA